MKGGIIVLLLFVTFLSFSQEESYKPTGANYSTYLGIGWSQFNAKPSSPSDFTSFEFRIGPTISIPLNSRVELQTRFLFGGKLKRQPYNKLGQPYVIPPPFLDLDEVVSSRNHYFFEIPLIIQFNLPKPKLSIYSGGNFRFFTPNNTDVDFLTNRGEFDILFGAGYPIFNRWKIGAEYFYGITKVYTSSGNIDGKEFDLRVSNNSFQFYVQYILK